VNNKSSEVFGIYQLETCLCFVRDVAVKLAQMGFGDFLGETVASKLKGNTTGTIIKRCYDKIVSSAGHNGFS
jgi:hypothetical protein